MPNQRNRVIVAVESDTLVGDIVSDDQIKPLFFQFAASVSKYIGCFGGESDSEAVMT